MRRANFVVMLLGGGMSALLAFAVFLLHLEGAAHLMLNGLPQGGIGSMSFGWVDGIIQLVPAMLASLLLWRVWKTLARSGDAGTVLFARRFARFIGCWWILQLACTAVVMLLASLVDPEELVRILFTTMIATTVMSTLFHASLASLLLGSFIYALTRLRHLPSH